MMAQHDRAKEPRQTENAPGEVRERPPYGFAALVFLAILGLYLITIAPTTQFWDTSEYIAAAKVLGIPHPPGNPLFVLIAHVWGMIPLVGHYALRINLLAAVTSLILGMGLPGVACYILLVILAAPALINLGVDPLAAHLFVFYFGVAHFITPPVALAAYVAAGISGARMMETALQAMRLGIVVNMIPFVFVYEPD